MKQFELACLRCASRYELCSAIDSRGCPICAEQAPANLFPRPTETTFVPTKAEPGVARASSSLWQYADALPVECRAAISLGEGRTPLLPVPKLGRELGVTSLFIKDEGRNPTWSHKDRFSTVFVSHARSIGAKVVATASSGNAGASLAAYAAAAGLHCIVATFASTAGAMVSQTRRYGATVVPFEDKRDRWLFLAEGANRHDWLIASPYTAPVVGSHPIGITGYKTMAYELAEQLEGGVPDWCILPVCYGDALIGLWEGFKELRARAKISKLPRLVAAEVYGSLQHALTSGDDRLSDQPMGFETLAVSIGTPRSTYQALQALRESNGVALPVGNDDLLFMQKQLAQREGLFCELASVAPLVAAKELVCRSVIGPKDSIVAIATASGLKDLDRSDGEILPLKPFSTIAQALRHVENRR